MTEWQEHLIYREGYRRGFEDAEKNRPRGEWIDTTSGEHWKCSICGCRASFFIYDGNKAVEWLSDFCPNCGAMMRGESDETD